MRSLKYVAAAALVAGAALLGKPAAAQDEPASRASDKPETVKGWNAFLDELRSITQVVILSDTFEEFAAPLMRQLAWPALLCHRLEIDGEGRVANYRLRQRDQKRRAVAAFRGLNYKVIAVGDSYNDTTMLGEADTGFLFRPPDSVRAEFPQFEPTGEYSGLMALIRCELEA